MFSIHSTPSKQHRVFEGSHFEYPPLLKNQRCDFQRVEKAGVNNIVSRQAENSDRRAVCVPRKASEDLTGHCADVSDSLGAWKCGKSILDAIIAAWPVRDR